MKIKEIKSRNQELKVKNQDGYPMRHDTKVCKIVRQGQEEKQKTQRGVVNNEIKTWGTTTYILLTLYQCNAVNTVITSATADSNHTQLP